MSMHDSSNSIADALKDVATLPELFAWRVALTPGQSAYRHFDAADLQWHDLSWQATAERVQEWMNALRRHELATGARVAILLPNGLDHVCMDLAALGLGVLAMIRRRRNPKA